MIGKYVMWAYDNSESFKNGVFVARIIEMANGKLPAVYCVVESPEVSRFFNYRRSTVFKDEVLMVLDHKDDIPLILKLLN